MKNASWMLTSAFAFATASCGGGDEGGGPCAGVTCSAHGECAADGASARCDCDEGYVASGLSCVPAGGDSDSDTDSDSDSDSDTGTGTECGAGLIVDETEDNDTCETAEDLGRCVVLARGTFGNDPTPCDDAEYVTFQIDAPTDVTVRMNDVADDGCGYGGSSVGTNNILSVYEEGCAEAVGSNDNSDGTLCASVDLPALPAGTYVVAVTAYLYCDYSGCGCLPGSNTDWELEIVR